MIMDWVAVQRVMTSRQIGRVDGGVAGANDDWEKSRSFSTGIGNSWWQANNTLVIDLSTSEIRWLTDVVRHTRAATVPHKGHREYSSRLCT